MLYIGVDLGTSAVKLLLMDEKGRIQKIVSRDYPISFPKPGWSEQNPEDWIGNSRRKRQGHTSGNFMERRTLRRGNRLSQ